MEEAVDIIDPCINGMMSPIPNGMGFGPETTGGEGTGRNPHIKILEQPASKALRFRYECEGRSAGSIPGVNNTSENKTYPKIQIVGFKGSAIIVVSCVTKDEPYRAHPHNLVGKEGCKDGIYTTKIENDDMTATFQNLGIQCVKKKDIEEALKTRERMRIDPFKQGFAHSTHPSSIDLNAVRLCFQVFLHGSDRKKFNVLQPVVSEPIYDKKAMSDLVITRLSHPSASVKGGHELILLCEKVAKEDIQVRFYEEASNGQLLWEDYGDLSPSQVHKQVAIWFKTPKYKSTEVDYKVKAFIQLRRPSDGATSEPLPFQFTPDDPVYRRKRPKPQERQPDFNDQLHVQNSMYRLSPESANSFYGISLQQAPFTPVKNEPCPSPDYPLGNSPVPPRSPYDNPGSSPSNYSPSPGFVGLNYVEERPLPPFSNVIPQHINTDQRVVGSETYQFLNPFAPNDGYNNMPHTFNYANTMPVAGNPPIVRNESSMFAGNNMQISETQTRNEASVISLELKVDSRDLVDGCQFDAGALSENLSQSLIITGYTPPEQNPNMTDSSLTRLVNEKADECMK